MLNYFDNKELSLNKDIQGADALIPERKIILQNKFYRLTREMVLHIHIRYVDHLEKDWEIQDSLYEISSINIAITTIQKVYKQKTYTRFRLPNNLRKRARALVQSRKRTQLILNFDSNTIREYYIALQEYEVYGQKHEGAVGWPFQILLNIYAKWMGVVFVPQYRININRSYIVLDGVFLDKRKIPFAFIEIKSANVDLDKEIRRKFKAGYPNTNILFYTPQRMVLYQNGLRTFDENITEGYKKQLIKGLKQLFSNYQSFY